MYVSLCLWEYLSTINIKGDVNMPRGVRKVINYEEAFQKIEQQIETLEAKKEALLRRKNEEDMNTIMEFIKQHNMTASDILAILSPAVAASAAKESVKI